MAQQKPSWVGEPFVDSNGFHLLAPSWMSEGDEVEWQNIISTARINRIINGITYVRDIDAIIADGTATSTSYLTISSVQSVNGHKYLIGGCAEGGSDQSYRIYNDGNGLAVYGKTPVVASSRKDSNVFIRVNSGVSVSNIVFMPQVIDLTVMGCDSIADSDNFAEVFYGNGSTATRIGYFAPSLNGTLIVHNGKLYRKKE